MLRRLAQRVWLRWAKLYSDEKGAEIIEVLFWVGVGLLAVLVLIPQVRTLLVGKMRAIISALRG
jgi:hypothetical protein